MANYRRGRINDEMQKVVAEILRELKDPRVSDAFLSVTGAEVTPDLKYAKIYYSALRGEPKEIKKGLVSSAGFIRKKVAERMNWRKGWNFAACRNFILWRMIPSGTARTFPNC